MTRRELSAAVLFAAAYTQSPVPYSNQTQYLLHGYAAAGIGRLAADDWLSGTADPTPAFSAFVAAAAPFGDWPFQVVFFLAVAGYFLVLWKLVEGSVPLWPWAFGMTLTHAGLVRWAADRLLGADYPWFLQCGLANQYVLGPGLQPSVAGVLLVAAVTTYARGRPVTAAALAAGVNYLHATYLLPAALLVAGFVAGEWAARRWRGGFAVGGAALAVVLPVVAFHLHRFGPTDPATFREAHRILADVRIPHHARPARWFDAAAGAQVAWILLGIAALRKTPLFEPLAVAAALAAAGTGVVLLTNDPTAALLFPWRVSAVLVPVATAVLVKGACSSRRKIDDRLFLPLVLTLAIISPTAVYGLRLGYREPEAEDPALAYVRATAGPGEVYLIPARFPKPTTQRGVYSATFTPPPDPTAPVYFELARFRILTGAGLYVDFKAIPYKDADVLEWHRRVANCEGWFASNDWDAAGVIDEVTREGVTHVVAPAKLGLRSRRLDEVFAGGAYKVYRIKP